MIILGRAIIECDLEKVIVRGHIVLLEGSRIWIPFYYEKLPRICFKCGRIVYTKKDCPYVEVEKEIQKKGEEQYGS